MATLTATEYVNGRVVITSFSNDEGTLITNTNSYTIGSYDYSLIPNKPISITNPEWWDTAHQGQESSLNPTYFADAFFALRRYDQTTPDRPATLKAKTLSRTTFNKISL